MAVPHGAMPKWSPMNAPPKLFVGSDIRLATRRLRALWTGRRIGFVALRMFATARVTASAPAWACDLAALPAVRQADADAWNARLERGYDGEWHVTGRWLGARERARSAGL